MERLAAKLAHLKAQQCKTLNIKGIALNIIIPAQGGLLIFGHHLEEVQSSIR
jgi:hypothetical protein